jgi:transcriptional regulator with XRE-family HTH domain
MVNLMKIKGCMAEHKHTQKDVAKILNLSVNSVNNKLLGKVKFTIEELTTLSKTYNLDINIFLI